MTPTPAQVLLLAAGRGERMRPLTDVTPKPLLTVNGTSLLGWHLQRLAGAGYTQAVINTAWLGAQVSASLGHTQHGMALRYSPEGQDFGHALETLGGIVRALPLLDDVFWVVAGDVYAPDFPFDPAEVAALQASPTLGKIWLVPNPPHHPKGDFCLHADGTVADPAPDDASPRLTFSTIGLYKKALFAPPLCDIPAGNPQGVAAPLGAFLRKAMAQGVLLGARYDGAWTDVGTPERLAALQTL